MKIYKTKYRLLPTGEKGRDLTQFYDKSPYNDRKIPPPPQKKIRSQFVQDLDPFIPLFFRHTHLV